MLYIQTKLFELFFTPVIFYYKSNDFGRTLDSQRSLVELYDIQTTTAEYGLNTVSLINLDLEIASSRQTVEGSQGK